VELTITEALRGKMRAIPYIKAGLISLLLLALAQAAFPQTKYIKRYRPLADSLSLEYEIPAAVILGVAILESSSGTSRNCKLLNNHFGIVGKNKLWKEKGIRTRYKQYKSAEDSYKDFCKLIKKKKYYKKLKGTTDPKPWIEAMSKYSYSEVPTTWKTRVLATIRKNKL
jgi:flagellum-specific peptidoglycan hydrolase FlgJ